MEIIDVLIAVDAPRIIRDFRTNDAAKVGQYQSLGEAHGYKAKNVARLAQFAHQLRLICG